MYTIFVQQRDQAKKRAETAATKANNASKGRSFGADYSEDPNRSGDRTSAPLLYVDVNLTPVRRIINNFVEAVCRPASATLTLAFLAGPH